MQTISQIFVTFLLNAFWQIALIAAAAAAGSWLLRSMSARYRHTLWSAALVLSLVLPLATAVWISARPDSPAINLAAPAETVNRPDTESPRIFAADAEIQAETSILALPLTIGTTFALGLFAAYLILVVYRSAKLAHSWRRTRAVAREAYQAELTDNLRWALARCSEVLETPQPLVLFSSSIQVPVMMGNLRPFVILPVQFLEETDRDILLTALGHEMVHATRHDFAFNFLFEVICLPLAFHPAALFAKRRIAHLRELCCDEVVATRLLAADAYARSLLNIAGSASNRISLSPITVGITDTENLEVRIMSLLKRTETSFPKKSFILAAAAALLVVPLVAAAFISPAVNVKNAVIQADVQATPPDLVEQRIKIDQKVEVPEEVMLERKITELRQALMDVNLPAEKREQYNELAVKLSRQLESVRKGDSQQSPDQEIEERRIKLEKTLVEIENARGQIDPSELDAKRQRVERELYRLGREREDVERSRADEERALRDQERAVYDQQRARIDQERMQEELELKLRIQANGGITLKQAIEIAAANYPGKVIEERISNSDTGEIFYHIATRNREGTTTAVIIGSKDGRIVKTETIK